MLRIAVARMDELEGDAATAPGWMSVDEQLRWRRGAAVARREFASGRALVRRLLRSATGVPAEEWLVSAQDGTAPVARMRMRDVLLHVSVSHRLGWVAAAVSERPVGVDLECARPARTDAADRAALMLSFEELPAWQALVPEQREPALLTAWTAKEAWFKAAPSGAAPWDFRRLAARACPPAQANVRVWDSPPLHVAVCADVHALFAASCDGLPQACTPASFWHVAPAAAS